MRLRAPAVLIGHNEDVAWGFTMSMVDDQDLFLLELDPSGTRERVGDEWRPLAIRTERIVVRGGGAPEELAVKVSRHGPIIREEKGAVVALSCFSCWCTCASIAWRNLGIDVSIARYATSPAATSGNSASGHGLSTAAATPPPNSSKFQR